MPRPVKSSAGRRVQESPHGRIRTPPGRAAARVGRGALRQGHARRVCLRASNYRQVPIGVVLPRTVADIVETMRVCSSRGVPVRAAGRPRRTGNGQRGGHHRLLEVPAACSRSTRRRASRASSPAWCCDAARRGAAHGLTFAPDPATHSRCTLGGMIGNNSCGPHSVTGTTVQNIERLEVLTYDGARVLVRAHLGCRPQTNLPRGLSVQDLWRSESNRRQVRGSHPRGIPEDPPAGLGLQPRPAPARERLQRGALAGRLRRHLCAHAAGRGAAGQDPPHRVLVVLGFPDIGAAGDAVPRVLAAGPIACEGLDEAIIGGLRERGCGSTTSRSCRRARPG